jgi:hypothetical protein
MLLNHAFGLFKNPESEWSEIRKEKAPPRRLYVAYVLVLGLIGPVCAYISTAHIGWTVGSDRVIRFTEISALQLSVLSYLAILVGVFALGYGVNWMARTYGAKQEQVPSRGVALVSYSCTPLFLAGFALLYPNLWFNVIVHMAAAGYGAWLMYNGLPVVMGIRKAQAVMYAGALLTLALVILVSTLAGSVILWTYGFGPVYASG